ncbi:MAG: dihydrolipoamide acetyltransferase family protein [Anaerolineae bacterium]|nr:dihydrolipoamide acetyltransferase family protein [Anaerolineae bacterium]
MAVDIIVPPLSQTMDSVLLVEWLKAVGDEVVKGEPLFVIETDKAHLEIEAPASGILQEVLAQAGSEVAVRSTIGVIASADEARPVSPRPEPAPEAARPASRAATAARHPAATGPGGQLLPAERQQRIFASPRARRLAQQEGVPLDEVQATGPQQMIVERDIRAYLAQRKAVPKATPVARRVAEAAGLDLATLAPLPAARITRADVEAALAAREAAAPAGVQWVDLSPTRRTIACRMAESQQAAAEVTLTRQADATELVRLREQILAELSEEDTRPTYTDFLVLIVARQLKRHPHLNAITDGERIGLSEEVHVAVAVDTERGLMAPVLRNADKKGLLQLARERAELVRRALDGIITPEELSGGTFTITNLGSLGVDAFTPIINPPQAAILGVGRICPAPAVHEGQLCIRQLMHLSLTFDHRVVDGAPAARFLGDVVQWIEKPHLIWL